MNELTFRWRKNYHNEGDWHEECKSRENARQYLSRAAEINESSQRALVQPVSDGIN